MSRTVNILGKKVSLIPLIAALIIGSVVIGYAANGFLTIIPNPFQQTTYHREETITIVDIPEYIEAFVTLEGETNEFGAFGRSRPITLGLVIHSLRPGFRVTDSYTLKIGEETVLSGTMTDVKVGTDHTVGGFWTPSELGPITVTLDIVDMVWTEIQYLTFTGFTFVNSESGLGLHDHTLPLNEQIETGTLVEFDFTVYNGNSNSITSFDYVVETSPDGSTWTNVASGSVSEVIIAHDEIKTVDVNFDAPPTEGTYEVKVTLTNVVWVE